jgi:transcription initiation factor TFIIE subunit alpha
MLLSVGVLREMKIQRKLIEEVAIRVAGEDVIPVVRTLMNRRDVSEFALADETGLEINLVRNMLYRLYNANLVTSIKRKDKKKGWYIYYWTLNHPRFQYLSKDIMKNRLIQLKERLSRENSSHFYICGRNCIRLNFEQATDFEFKCPECGDLLNQDDNVKKIKEIEKEINYLEKEMKKKLPPLPKLPESKLAKDEDVKYPYVENPVKQKIVKEKKVKKTKKLKSASKSKKSSKSKKVSKTKKTVKKTSKLKSFGKKKPIKKVTKIKKSASNKKVKKKKK